MAGRDVVRDEPAGGGHDDDVVDYQGRAREAPARVRCARVGRCVARPDDGAVMGVERVHDSGRPECVDATVAEGRRPARTGAAIRLPEPRRVAVSPYQLAVDQVVAGDVLVVTALLLGVDEIATDRERRPARSDWPPPQLDGRRLGPIGLDPYAANDTVAIGSAKAGPLGVRFDLNVCQVGRACRRVVAGWSRDSLLGSLRGCRSRRRRYRRIAGLTGSALCWDLRWR